MKLFLLLFMCGVFTYIYTIYKLACAIFAAQFINNPYTYTCDAQRNFAKVAREDVRVKKSTAPPGFERRLIECRDPLLVNSGALPTELCCSCQPIQNRKTLSLEHQTHSSCESTQAGGTQPSTVTHTFHIESTMRGAPMRYN